MNFCRLTPIAVLIVAFSLTCSAEPVATSSLKTAVTQKNSPESKSKDWKASGFLQQLHGRLQTTPKGSPSVSFVTDGMLYVGASLAYKDLGLRYSVPFTGYSGNGNGGERAHTSHFVTGLSQNFRSIRLRGDYGRYQGFKLEDERWKDMNGNPLAFNDSSMRLEHANLQMSFSLQNKDFDFRKFEDYKFKGSASKTMFYGFSFYQRQRIETGKGLYSAQFRRSLEPQSTLISGRLESLGAGLGWTVAKPVRRGALYSDFNLGVGPERQKATWSDHKGSDTVISGRGYISAGYGLAIAKSIFMDLNFETSYYYSKVEKDEVRTSMTKILVSLLSEF